MSAVLLAVVVLGLALVAGVGSDRWLDPAIRSALIPVGLLVAYSLAALVVGPGRRRT